MRAWENKIKKERDKCRVEEWPEKGRVYVHIKNKKHTIWKEKGKLVKN
jgi:hypothetical protein